MLKRRRPRHRETQEAEGHHAEEVTDKDDEPEREGAHAAIQLRVCPQLRRVRRENPLAEGKDARSIHNVNFRQIT